MTFKFSDYYNDENICLSEERIRELLIDYLKKCGGECMKANLKILEQVFLGRDTELLFIQHEEGFEVSICIRKLQEPYYCNQLYKHFTNKENALAFFNEIKSMREQEETE